jgi:hypothetical protein
MTTATTVELDLDELRERLERPLRYSVEKTANFSPVIKPAHVTTTQVPTVRPGVPAPVMPDAAEQKMELSEAPQRQKDFNVLRALTERHEQHEKNGDFRLSSGFRERMAQGKIKGSPLSISAAVHRPTGTHFIVMGLHDMHGNVVRHAAFGIPEFEQMVKLVPGLRKKYREVRSLVKGKKTVAKMQRLEQPLRYKQEDDQPKKAPSKWSEWKKWLLEKHEKLNDALHTLPLVGNHPRKPYSDKEAIDIIDQMSPRKTAPAVPAAAPVAPAVAPKKPTENQLLKTIAKLDKKKGLKPTATVVPPAVPAPTAAVPAAPVVKGPVPAATVASMVGFHQNVLQPKLEANELRQKGNKKAYSIDDKLRGALKPNEHQLSFAVGKNAKGNRFIVVGQHNAQGELLGHGVFGYDELATHSKTAYPFLADHLKPLEHHFAKSNSHAVTKYAAYKAPAGGAVVRGVYYKGGSMLPSLQQFSRSMRGNNFRKKWKNRLIVDYSNSPASASCT